MSGDRAGEEPAPELRSLTAIWTRLHVETGLSLADFEELEPADIDDIGRALRDKHRRETRRDANYYALLCNLHGSGKRVWKAEDFLPDDDAEPIDPAEAQAALAAYEAMMARGRTTASRR